MKSLFAALAAAVLLSSAMAAGDITSVAMAKEMSPGWNLGNTLEALPDETSWGNPKPNQALFDAVKAAGFKSVRIPVAWMAHADADGEIKSGWLDHVAEVVDMARKAGLTVVLNEHWDKGWQVPTEAKKAEVNARLAKLWTQVAGRFRDYDDHLLFAGTNEIHIEGEYGKPTSENAAVQNSFNQTFVDTVRATGGNNAGRVLVVQSYNTNIDAAATSFVLPKDSVPNRLMLEVHYYDPYNFTLNEKSRIWQWGKLAVDPAATETWANEDYADKQFDKMKTMFVDKGVGVILGEYCAIMRTEYPGSERQRVYWAIYITKSARQHGLVPMYWDAGAIGNHAAGLFVRSTGEQPYPYLVDGVVKVGQ